MEYNLLLEQKTKKLSFIFLVTGICIAILAIFFIMGFYGLGLFCLILLSLIATPFVYGRHRLFLILWLLIVPFFDNFTPFLLGSTSMVTYAATALTIPSALILFFKESHNVFKELPYLKYLAIFTVIMVLNFFRSRYFLGDITEILRYLIQIFVIFSTYFFIKDNNSNTLIKYIAIFINANALVTIFQRFTGIGMKIIENIPRVQGLLGHPNVTGFVINIFLPLALLQFLKAETKKDRTIWSISLVINIFALILTMTKVCYFSFALMLLVLFFYLPIKAKTRIFIGSIVICAILIAINYIFNLKIIESFADRLENTSSYEWRLRTWGLILQGIKGVNVFIGNGINSAYYYLLSMGINNKAHSVYLQLLYEYGVTGIFFYLSFLQPFSHFFKKHIFNKDKVNKTTFLFPLLIMISIFINMYSDNSVLLRTPMYFTWAILTYFYMQSNQSELSIESKNT